MNTTDKLIAVAIICVTIWLMTITICITMYKIETTKAAFACGYEQGVVPGYNVWMWLKK